MRSLRPASVIERLSLLNRNTKTIIAVVLVASLIALNVYTVEALSLKSPTPIPGYPSITMAYNNGNLMLLIKGALGPYLYNNITVNGTYSTASSSSLAVLNYTTNTIYLALTLQTTNMSFRSTALDLINHEMYYFNASVSVNISASTSDTVFNFPGGQMNYVVLGLNPLEVAMEGYSYG